MTICLAKEVVILKTKEPYCSSKRIVVLERRTLVGISLACIIRRSCFPFIIFLFINCVCFSQEERLESNLDINYSDSEYIKQVEKSIRALDFSEDTSKISTFEIILDSIWRHRSIQNRVRLRLAFGIFGKRLYDARFINRSIPQLERAKYFMDKPDKYTSYLEHALGLAYSITGDMDKSTENHLLNLEYLRTANDSRKLARVYNYLGRNCFLIGDTLRSYEYFEEGLVTAEDDRDIWLDITLYYIEALIKFGEFDQARTKLFEASFEEDSEIPHGDYFANWARFYESCGDLSSAIDCMGIAINEKIKEEGSMYNRYVAKFFLQLGELYLAKKECDLVRSHAIRGIQCIVPELDSTKTLLPEKESIYLENTFIDLFYLYANSGMCDARSSQLTDELYETCMLAIDHGLHVNRGLRETFVMAKSKEINISYHKSLVNTGVVLTYLKYEENPSPRLVQNARNLFDVSKSMLFNESALEKRSFASLTGDEKESLVNMSHEIDSLNRLYDNNDIAHVQLKYLIDLEETRTKLLNFRNFNERSSEINTPFIEYNVGGEHVHALYYFNTSLKLIYCGRTDTLNKLVSMYRRYLNEPPDGVSFEENEFRNLSIRLFDFLFGDIPKLPSSFVVIPDGVIHNVNFDVLIPDIQGDYLLLDHQVDYVHHSALLKNPTTVEHRELPMLLCAPVYFKGVSAPVVKERGSLYPLAHNKSECEEIQEILTHNNTDFVIRLSRNWVDQLNNYNSFHFAGHSIVDGRTAFLAMTEKENDRIFASSIAGIRLDLDLITLSACESGVGMQIEGEGVASLGRAFAMAGVDHVIQSLWLANDQSTKKLMVEFYRSLADKYSFSSALHQAKINFLRSASPEFRHPYYWASFIHYGIGGEERGNKTFWYVLILGLLVILLLFKIRMK